METYHTRDAYARNRLHMTCGKCHSINSQHDSRCGHCGRSLDATANDITSDGIGLQFVHGNLAAVRVPERRTQAVSLSETDTQASLFEKPAGRSNLIAFESIPGARIGPRPAPARTKTLEQKVAGTGSNHQSSFDFGRTANHTAAVQPIIYCAAPVANPLHRALAGALDLSIVLMGFMLFLVVFLFADGSSALTKGNALYFGVAFGLILMTYGLLFVLCNGDSTGMRCFHLCLTNFEGEKPNRRERLVRHFGILLCTICSVGLGAIWAFFNEEKLAWHDQSSKTFPTWRPPKK